MTHIANPSSWPTVPLLFCVFALLILPELSCITVVLMIVLPFVRTSKIAVAPSLLSVSRSQPTRALGTLAEALSNFLGGSHRTLASIWL